MSRENPTDDPREDPDQTKGTNKPWKRPGQKSQNPDESMPSQPDLETWQKSSTH